MHCLDQWIDLFALWDACHELFLSLRILVCQGHKMRGNKITIIVKKTLVCKRQYIICYYGKYLILLALFSCIFLSEKKKEFMTNKKSLNSGILIFEGIYRSINITF